MLLRHFLSPDLLPADVLTMGPKNLFRAPDGRRILRYTAVGRELPVRKPRRTHRKIISMDLVDGQSSK